MVSKSPTGRLVYDFNDAEGARYRFSSQYAMHMRDKTDDGMIGRSRLARSGASVEHAKELSDAVEALFYNGVTPSLAITVNGRLSPESRDQLTAQIRDQFAGVKNRGKFLVLDSTESVTNIDVTAEDSELLESRRFSVVEICRLFGVPPPLAQSYEHNTFTNSQEATRWFSTFTLSHWARKFEQAFSRTMLPKSLELELDMSAFTRSDTGERWNAYQIALANGVLTPEQVRELEGWEV
jgi:HK97 family phage portal protein